ncbi:hypothetical protein J7E24_13460 [Hymenobacter sp. ISL-91]|uniref:hypothetical protein n=1 Tax=Hymenobacter sp. ISL-91 TaxID=2819151 RepID=UPI001BEBBB53|nr:hypothetical protein [Hymenobacter sp. ISL-91]MBT2558799.1 hypothetical protein [Hymenobacter sp. ISL-91]
MDGEELEQSIEAMLPECLYLSDFSGNFQDYISAVYEVFCKDFVDSRPKFRGKRLALKKYPITDGWEATFYHLTHEGEDEQNRTPCMQRCERIPWLRMAIEQCDSLGLKVWPQTRKGKTRICIWVELEHQPDHFIILDDRGDYILLWTAYPLTYKHQKEKKRKEYGDYIKTLRTQQGPPT